MLPIDLFVLKNSDGVGVAAATLPATDADKVASFFDPALLDCKLSCLLDAVVNIGDPSLSRHKILGWSWLCVIVWEYAIPEVESSSCLCLSSDCNNWTCWSVLGNQLGRSKYQIFISLLYLIIYMLRTCG